MTEPTPWLRARASLWFLIAAVTVVGAWATRFGTRWPSVYYMTGSSMEPTVAPNEYYLAWGPPGRLSPGDLVLFRFEDGEEVFHVLRRVAALPADTVSMESGRVVLNGVTQETPFRIVEPLASYSPLAIEGDLYDWGPWITPPDSVVLLADTRDILGWPDSRFIGFVAVADIIARATRTVTGRRLR